MYAQPAWQQMMLHRDTLMAQIDNDSDAIDGMKPAALRREVERLHKIIFFDTLLLKQLIATLPPDTLIPELRTQIQSLNGHNRSLQQQFINSEEQHVLIRSYLNMLMIVSFILLIFALMVLILWLRQRAKAKQLEVTNSKFYTDLHALQSEIEKHQETQKQLATAINKSKSQHADEREALTRQNQQLAEEVLMLQNQIAAIKTAYESEVDKRHNMMLQMENYPPADADKMEALRNQITELKKMQNDLRAKYDNEVAIRLMFEKEVTSLLERIKTNFGA
jgi:hypothetical protein